MERGKYGTQLKRVYAAFNGKPKTMFEVSVETYVERPNVCRYVSMLMRGGLIALCRVGKCPITGYKAGFYSTDRKLFPKREWRQLCLFDIENIIEEGAK